MPLTVNGEVIEDATLREERRFLRQRYAAELSGMDALETERHLEALARRTVVARVLLRQQAWKDPRPVPAELINEALQAGPNKFTENAAADDAFRGVEETLRIKRLLAEVESAAQRPNRKEIDLYYKTHRSEFYLPERVHVSQIVKNVDESSTRDAALAAVTEAQEELRKGTPFAQVAERFSDCPTNGGDLGWFARGEMVEEFDREVFSLNTGDTSAIFETRFGFHIVRLVERKTEGIASLSEVRDTLATRLLNSRKQQALDAYLEKLMANSDIQLVSSAAISR
jgi:parvulin-like peptidyl-prolyl isomerase